MKLTMLGYTSRLFIILPFFVYSNFQDSIQKIDLDNVIVKSTRIDVNKKQAPLSVSVKKYYSYRGQLDYQILFINQLM